MIVRRSLPGVKEKRYIMKTNFKIADKVIEIKKGGEMEILIPVVGTNMEIRTGEFEVDMSVEHFGVELVPVILKDAGFSSPSIVVMAKEVGRVLHTELRPVVLNEDNSDGPVEIGFCTTAQFLSTSKDTVEIAVTAEVPACETIEIFAADGEKIELEEFIKKGGNVTLN